MIKEMFLVDTHCHIHEENYPLDVGDVIRRAYEAGVGRMICVGTSVQSSKEAIDFAAQHEGIFASIGVHPHDTKDGWEGLNGLLVSASPSLPLPQKHANSRPVASSDTSLYFAELPGGQTSSNSQDVSEEATGRTDSISLGRGNAVLQQSSRSSTPVNKHLQPELSLMHAQGRPGVKPFVSGGTRKGERNSIGRKLVAVGEIGLDYFYTHSPRDVQIKALEGQIDLALKYNLPVIFHVREAFDDFWPIFDNFSGLRGVLHSFTDTSKNAEEALKRCLFIGVNGISTFTKDPLQQQLFASLPLEKLLLETDAPFLTPAPLRGKVNEPAFVRNVAEFHAISRGISLEEIAEKTTANARALFALS